MSKFWAAGGSDESSSSSSSSDDSSSSSDSSVAPGGGGGGNVGGGAGKTGGDNRWVMESDSGELCLLLFLGEVRWKFEKEIEKEARAVTMTIP
jgi:hypothetical protein